MPNWCDNTVMIKGPKEEIVKLRDKLQDYSDKSVFNFEAILKCPQELRAESAPQRNEQRAAILKKKYGASDWYDWSNEHWGTKWNASDSTITVEYDDEDNYVVSYSFQTAWAPPLPLYEALAEQNPNINMYVCFDESGMGFAGWRYYRDGELISEHDYDTSFYGMRTHMEPDSDIWEWV